MGSRARHRATSFGCGARQRACARVRASVPWHIDVGRILRPAFRMAGRILSDHIDYILDPRQSYHLVVESTVWCSQSHPSTPETLEGRFEPSVTVT
jgi:hypothetical protein